MLEDGASQPPTPSLFPDDRAERLAADASIVRLWLAELIPACLTADCRSLPNQFAVDSVRVRQPRTGESGTGQPIDITWTEPAAPKRGSLDPAREVTALASVAGTDQQQTA